MKSLDETHATEIRRLMARIQELETTLDRHRRAAERLAGWLATFHDDETDEESLLRDAYTGL